MSNWGYVFKAIVSYLFGKIQLFIRSWIIDVNIFYFKHNEIEYIVFLEAV